MRGCTVMVLLMLAGCGGADDTPMWMPGERPVPSTGSVTETSLPPAAHPAPVLSAPRARRPVPRPETPSAANPPPSYTPEPAAPSVTSRRTLTDAEFRSLQGVRQSLDASIRDLERRSTFDRTTGSDDARLRAMKAPRRDVLRRLRGR